MLASTVRRSLVDQIEIVDIFSQLLRRLLLCSLLLEKNAAGMQMGAISSSLEVSCRAVGIFIGRTNYFKQTEG